MTRVLMRSKRTIVLAASLVVFAGNVWTQENKVRQSRSVDAGSRAVVPIVTVAVWQQDPHLMGHVARHDTAWEALMKNMETMHEGMAAIEPSGNDDTDFVNLMLPHHQAAIDMAKTELLYGSDPQMRRLAQEIITDQESEIQLMQIWLNRQRGHTNDPSQLQGSGSRREK